MNIGQIEVREIKSILEKDGLAAAIDYTYEIIDEYILFGDVDDAASIISELAGTDLPLSILISALVISGPNVREFFSDYRDMSILAEPRNKLKEAIDKIAVETSDDKKD